MSTRTTEQIQRGLVVKYLRYKAHRFRWLRVDFCPGYHFFVTKCSRLMFRVFPEENKLEICLLDAFGNYQTFYESYCFKSENVEFSELVQEIEALDPPSNLRIPTGFCQPDRRNLAEKALAEMLLY